MNGRMLWQKALEETDLLAKMQWLKRSCFHLIVEGDVIDLEAITPEIMNLGVRGKEFQMVTRRFVQNPWVLHERLTEQDYCYLQRLSDIDGIDYLTLLAQLENKQVIAKYPDRYIQGLVADAKSPVSWQWNFITDDVVKPYIASLLEHFVPHEYGLWSNSNVLQWDWSTYGWLAPSWDPAYLHAIFLQGHNEHDLDIVLAMIMHVHGVDEDALLDYQVLLHWWDPQGYYRTLNRETVESMVKVYDYPCTQHVLSQEKVLGDIWREMSPQTVLTGLLTSTYGETPVYTS